VPSVHGTADPRRAKPWRIGRAAGPSSGDVLRGGRGPPRANENPPRIAPGGPLSARLPPVHPWMTALSQPTMLTLARICDLAMTPKRLLPGGEPCLAHLRFLTGRRCGLVLRFRISPHLAPSSGAKFGIKGALAISMLSSAAYEFEVPKRACRQLIGTSNSPHWLPFLRHAGSNPRRS
jgi:hypothetical protein